MRILPFIAGAAAVIIAAPPAVQAQAPTSADRTVRPADSAIVASTSMTTDDIKRIDHCARSGVFCLTRLQLDANPSARLSDLLVHANGVFRHCDGSTSNCALLMHPAAGTGTCTPSYYVDGSPISTALDNPLTVLESALQPSDVQKIEVYRSEQRPRELGAGPWRDCGAIVIWRR